MDVKKIKRTAVLLGSVLVIAMMVQGINAGELDTAIVKGVVYNETGAPLAGVNVTWENATTHELYKYVITGGDGGYIMSLKFEGTRESLITASKFGYYPNSTVISVTSGGVPFPEYEANFTLEKDVTPPSITNLQPSDGAIINNNKPTIGAEYSDAAGINTSAVTMSVDGVDVTDSAVITESSISYVPPDDLGDGVHNVNVYVEDTNANPASAAWSFTVDTVAPVVDIISPEEGVTYKVETVDLNCTATDPNDISVVWYSLDGGANVTIEATDTTTFNTTLTGLSSGEHCVSVYANDTAGNIGFDSECFNIEARVWVNVSLLEGWNMIGVPLNVSNWTLPTVLSSIDGNYEYVFYFNATIDDWNIYYADYPPEMSNLFELKPGAGYLIKMKTADMLNWYGLKFETPSRYLESGWNMFSVPYGIANGTLPAVLDSIDGNYEYVFYFNATIDDWNIYYADYPPEMSNLFELKPGAGYLIKMKTADTFVPEME